MKTFARVAIIIIYVIEVFCVLGAVTGLLFKSLALAGADQLIMLSFFLFGCAYFLVAIIPYYKKLVSGEPVFQQMPILILRRLLYVALGWLAFADLFYLLNLNGKETLGPIVLISVLILIIIAGVLIFLEKERKHVFQWVFYRLAIFLLVYFKVSSFA